jgi:hypothetical protein
MKECDKRNSHLSRKRHMIYISSDNVRHLVTNTFTTLHPTALTPLHYTSRHFTSSHLNFSQLHFTTLSFGLTPSKFPTAPSHLTSLHFTPWWLPLGVESDRCVTALRNGPISVAPQNAVQGCRVGRSVYKQLQSARGRTGSRDQISDQIR